MVGQVVEALHEGVVGKSGFCRKLARRRIGRGSTIGLNTDIHFRFAGMGNGVAAEFDIGTIWISTLSRTQHGRTDFFMMT